MSSVTSLTEDAMSRTLGDRVRDLRTKRGLSQGSLARDLVSPSYVSLIEAGKRLPERDILRAFADRLGTTPEYLETGVDAATAKEEQLALKYADLALANGEVQEALERYGRLAATGVVSRHGAEWGLVRALEAQGDLPGAIGRIEWLLEEHRAGRADTPGLLVLLNLQCRLYREMGDINYSITIGEQALEEVQRLGLKGTEDEIRLASSLVASYWERGDWARANQLAREVVERAEVHGSPRSRGSAYWNASIAASAVGGVSLALELADRAIAMFSEGEDERMTARLRTDVAKMMLRHGPSDLSPAHNLLTKAHAMLTEVGVQTDLASCETELARYHLATGKPETALQYADRALGRLADWDATEMAKARLMRAYALKALGSPEQSLELCREVMRALREHGRYRQHMAVCREAAELLVRLGEPDEAIDAYRLLADCGGARVPPWLTAMSTAMSQLAESRPKPA
jgi:transcriptional regulator with XRE-family HTH domain